VTPARVFLKQIEHTAFEQDVKVTEIKERSVKLEEGDEVEVLVRGKVGNVYGDPPEVEIVQTQAVKILSVKRRKK
jgi:hypothetical protein